MQKNTISIILPTFNERENIGILIQEIEVLFEKTHKHILREIIIVDDNSPDGTAALCKKLSQRYKNLVVCQKEKEGIGVALRYGYNVAKGEIILSMDSDLSFSVVDIPLLLEKIQEGNDLVIGCRHTIQGAKYEQKVISTMVKGFISKTGNMFISLLLGIKLHDFSGNFRAIRKKVWVDIMTTEKSNLLLLEMIVKTHKLGYNIAEVPVIFRERRFGKSKLNLLLESFRFIYRLLFYYW